jgi:hypothetical protein
MVLILIYILKRIQSGRYKLSELITNKWNFSKPSNFLNRRKEPTVNEILDKINSKGMNSLSDKEKQILKKHSTK